MSAPVDVAGLVGELRLAFATASNDDDTKAGSVERKRHVARLNAMLEAADALTAQAAEIADERLRATVFERQYRQACIDHATAMAEIKRLRGAIAECADYFDRFADADCDQDGFIPNEEMRMASMLAPLLPTPPKEDGHD